MASSETFLKQTPTKAEPVSPCNKTQHSLSPLPKLVNTNCLNILNLSVNCLYEIVNSIKQHLIYVKATDFKLKSQDLITLDNIVFSKDTYEHLYEQEAQFLVYLHEFLNFEDLKQAFSIIIRFYCYNEHVYTNSLIRQILLTNELFLNTFETVSDYIKENESKEQQNIEKDQDTDGWSESNVSTKSLTVASSLNEKHKNIQEIYNLYYNTDTSFMLQKVNILKFRNNNPK